MDVKIQKQFVAPFYLKLMSYNALAIPPRLRRRLVRTSKAFTVDHVRPLLREGWREVVMGTWFAPALPPDQVRDDIVNGMAVSQGGLTAPPLAAVSALLVGPEAIPAMRVYLERIDDPIRRDDTYEFVSAAIAHLGGTPDEEPSPAHVAAFDDLLEVARGLRHDFQKARS